MGKVKEYEVPEFSFGTKAVIRPLPTQQTHLVKEIKTLGELKQRLAKLKKGKT